MTDATLPGADPFGFAPGPGGGMADAADSKSAGRKVVWVQVPPRAHEKHQFSGMWIRPLVPVAGRRPKSALVGAAPGSHSAGR
jgi:hypothetical protein